MRKPSFALTFALLLSLPCLAQQTTATSQPVQENTSTPADSPIHPSGPIMETKKIPPGSKFYIAPIEGGYDIYLAAAIQEKKLPIVIVTDPSKAD